VIRFVERWGVRFGGQRKEHKIREGVFPDGKDSLSKTEEGNGGKGSKDSHERFKLYLKKGDQIRNHKEVKGNI